MFIYNIEDTITISFFVLFVVAILGLFVVAAVLRGYDVGKAMFNKVSRSIDNQIKKHKGK